MANNLDYLKKVKKSYSDATDPSSDSDKDSDSIPPTSKYKINPTLKSESAVGDYDYKKPDDKTSPESEESKKKKMLKKSSLTGMKMPDIEKSPEEDLFSNN